MASADRTSSPRSRGPSTSAVGRVPCGRARAPGATVLPASRSPRGPRSPGGRSPLRAEVRCGPQSPQAEGGGAVPRGPSSGSGAYPRTEVAAGRHPRGPMSPSAPSPMSLGPMDLPSSPSARAAGRHPGCQRGRADCALMPVFRDMPGAAPGGHPRTSSVVGDIAPPASALPRWMDPPPTPRLEPIRRPITGRLSERRTPSSRLFASRAVVIYLTVRDPYRCAV